MLLIVAPLLVLVKSDMYVLLFLV